MHRVPAISKSYALSMVLHVILLLGAFVAYDPSTTNLYDAEVVERLFITTMPVEKKAKPEVIKEEPPKSIKRRPRIKRRKPPTKKVVVQPPKEPEPAKPEVKETPPPTQKTRKASLKVIGAKAKSGTKRDVATNKATQDRATGTVTESPTEEPEAKVVDKVDIKRLERSYYGTLSGFLRRNYTYPRRARIARIEGVVLIEVVIDRTGKILRKRIARSSGSDLLDQAAMDAIAKVDKVPPPPDGLPWTRRAVRIPFKYKLRT